MSLLKHFASYRFSRYFKLYLLLWDLVLLNTAIILSFLMRYGNLKQIYSKEVQTVSLLSNLFWIFLLMYKDSYRMVWVERVETILLRMIRHVMTHLSLIAIFVTALEYTQIHISTDFVLEGNNPHALNEGDVTKPINVYGLTKLVGELAISKATKKYFIVRTSWLYSEFANNFVKTMLRLGTERKELGIIVDQIGSPTYGVDLAGCIFDLIQTKSTTYGLYHYSNEGVTSWYDFAKAIFELAAYPIHVKPLKTIEYPTKAIRPVFSVMDKNKIKNNFNIEIPYWRDSLAKCITQIKLDEKTGFVYQSIGS